MPRIGSILNGSIDALNAMMASRRFERDHLDEVVKKAKERITVLDSDIQGGVRALQILFDESNKV